MAALPSEPHWQRRFPLSLSFLRSRLPSYATTIWWWPAAQSGGRWRWFRGVCMFSRLEHDSDSR
ncbi:hypothetical protein Hanom_Chr12g01111791 [Helianthus anomalus]